MMIHAYDEEYLPLAQRILGDAADFAIVSLNLDPDTFAGMFIVSGAAAQIEIGNPAYTAGMTGCELVRDIFMRCGLEDPGIPDEMFVDKSPEYWAGWVLAYTQWLTARPFAQLLKDTRFSAIIEMYPAYHEMDVQKSADVLLAADCRERQISRLKAYRQACNLSQSKLAKRAEVPIRQIQMFEQGQRDINKLQALNLFKISKALHCRMEDLLEI